MAKKKGAAAPAHNITPERAARLYRLVQLLGHSSQTRTALIRALSLNVRGFYRDLEVLRQAGVAVALVKSRYILEDAPADAAERLPFPDPGLTLGEARQLARGRTRAHKKVRDQIRSIER
jgi:predicted DNA-binding transcriptional regulator YafY